uniref:Uncharacterized protein n=1 Tax=Ixodes ricinus TaxID=34613 RepID=A0A6B0UD00_IXORI
MASAQSIAQIVESRYLWVVVVVAFRLAHPSGPTPPGVVLARRKRVPRTRPLGPVSARRTDQQSTDAAAPTAHTFRARLASLAPSPAAATVSVRQVATRPVTEG